MFDRFVRWFHELLFNESTNFLKYFILTKKETLQHYKFVKTGFVDSKFRFLISSARY